MSHTDQFNIPNWIIDLKNDTLMKFIPHVHDPMRGRVVYSSLVVNQLFT